MDDLDEECTLRNLYELFLEYDEVDSYCYDEEDDLEYYECNGIYDEGEDYDDEIIFDNKRINVEDLYYTIEEEVEDYPEFDDWD
jgi:hypothetical protein